MLCIPTLAAGEQDAPGAGAYVPDPQYTVVWGAVTRQDNGSLLVQKPGETKPTDGEMCIRDRSRPPPGG